MNAPHATSSLTTRELQIEATLETRAIHRDGRPLVLVVEASRRVQRILLECLEPEYATVSALTVSDGLQKAASLRPDLMIVDAALPGVDSLLGAQRHCVELAPPSILVLTDGQDPHEVARMLEGCADDAMQKPFLTREVKARVRNLVRAKRTRDMLGQMVGERDGDLIELARNGARQLHDWNWAVKEVQAARRTAEHASRIKSNFLRIMSHELKTPITAMQLQMRVLQQDPEVTLSTKLDEGFERIWRSSRRLLHLLDTVLEWARVEGGRCELTMELFDLAALVSEVIAELLPHAAQKGIALELHTAEASAQLVTGDRRLVHLVVVNMLARAVQVTGAGGIEVTVGRTGGLHSVSVKDGGSPIPTEQRSEVFDPLLSSDGLHYRSGNGSGLGLHVVRDLARAFDGEVVLQPMDGPGNTFVLKLPALPPERSTARIWTGGIPEPAHLTEAR